MKKLILAIIVAALLPACSQKHDGERTADGASKATFVKEGSFNNCDVGVMRWSIDDSIINSRSVYAVICKDQPSTSLEWTSGKTHVNSAVVGNSTEELTKQVDQLQKEAVEKQKQLALSKLSDEERKLLNVH